ncbi:hypothetical protein O6H91_01G023600 [Diphasiastrum complanatum]|uniref:Uncharacterized protein n=1 Tax=Diphasiastrum complanatum TaxID=34168 RepID=A0ACC2EP09_DIPCM|nr:hypothetical protein O6H91_01G023600 [Diphasiastrum complanatum]
MNVAQGHLGLNDDFKMTILLVYLKDFKGMHDCSLEIQLSRFPSHFVKILLGIYICEIAIHPNSPKFTNLTPEVNDDVRLTLVKIYMQEQTKKSNYNHIWRNILLPLTK